YLLRVTPEQVWERPWSLEEIRRSSQNWSLGADAGLLNFLREFSQQIVSRTHDIEKQLDGLVRETKATDCRLHNIFNDFLMLSNTQFIENRVYDEEIEEPVTKPDTGDKPEQEKSREQKEAELIPKIQQAVNYGLQVLETAFEPLDIKAGNSDSEEEEVNGRVEPILEPKDLYLDRPLPHLIGSQLFMQQDDVGLGDISSEGSFPPPPHLKEDFILTCSCSLQFLKHLALSDEDEDDDNSSDLFDEDDDIFKPPKLTDDDFSPFGTKGHLFSGGHGLFDDDEEVGIRISLTLFTCTPDWLTTLKLKKDLLNSNGQSVCICKHDICYYGKHDDLFPASPPAGKHTKPKSKTVLSLFEDEEEDPFEDRLPINVKEKISEKGSHVKSTGVFQDEELLFSQEVQRDNDPDVDLFASTKKQSVSFGFISTFFASFYERRVLLPKPADPAPFKTKSPSPRIGKLQANLHFNPAAMLPGAVPKLPSSRVLNQEHQSADVTDSRSPIQADDSMRGGVSFESPVQVDTLHSANKTRAKVGGKRRPPTRLGRKLASQESSETDDQGLFSSVSPTHDRKLQDESLKASNVTERDPHVSSIKVSLSENDIQSNSKTTIVTKPLTPDVDDLFGSDLFANTAVSSPPASKINDPSPNAEFTSKPLPKTGKKSAASALSEDGSVDDLFQKVKPRTTKAVKPSSLVENEPGDDLFGNSKTDVKTVTPKEAKAATKDIFKDDMDDIFATESTKPVKKAKEKKQTQEPNLFDDNLDIFADFTHKSKDKKSKKKAEPKKSIFDDDMDDIFSSSNVKKSKPKVKPSHPAAEPKPDSKPSSAFEDPLNVLGN
uniref:FAM21/CAPZIP domain-containing protein n=1 Tax=Leptobrachium leishanense TaxID=445787 RepID=A0A8C5QKD5_9ANUR